MESLEGKLSTLSLSVNFTYPVNNRLSQVQICTLRHNVYNKILNDYLNNNANFATMPNILYEMFNLYDDIFFSKRISEMLNEGNHKLNFEYSNAMTSAAGKFIHNKHKICTIRISSCIILNTFKNGTIIHSSNGLDHYNRLECLMSVFEHELVHLIVYLSHGTIKKDIVYSSHGYYFQDLVKSYFGHTEFKHNLKTDVSRICDKNSLSVNDTVAFKDRSGNIIIGKINKLNPKTAKIDKYSVPYALLFIPNNDEVQIHKDAPDPKYKVGDYIVFETSDKNTIVDVIIRVNAKSYSTSKYNACNIQRLATKEEISSIKSEPSKKDFHVNDMIFFDTGKTRITGKIIKLNPVKAVVMTDSCEYSVPYSRLQVI